MKITPSDEGRSFAELPPDRLDPADKKFLAVAVTVNAVLYALPEAGSECAGGTAPASAPGGASGADGIREWRDVV